MTTQKAVMRVASICLKVIIFIVIVLGIVSLGQTTYRYTHAVFSDEAIEEERRLCYVAITRAKKELWIINAKRRILYGQPQVNAPSRFIDEIDDKYIETENNTTSLFKKVTKFNKDKMFNNIDIEYNKGDKIKHTDYGIGTITEVDKRIITVEFPIIGTKKFIKNHKSIMPV